MPTATSSGLSYTFYSGDGVSTTFPIDFGFIGNGHVTVKVNGTLKTEVDDYNVVNTDVVFIDPPTSGDDVRITRVTPRALDARFVDFRSFGVITEDQMDLNQKQVWYLIQEALESDNAGEVNPNAEWLQWDDVSDVWTALRSGVAQKIANVADPADTSDAANKGYVDDISEWGIAGIPQAWSFTAIASQTVYTLTDGSFLDEKYLIVSIEGIIQRPGVDFTVNPGDPHSELVWTGTTPDAGQTISVQNFGKARFLNTMILGVNSVPSSAIQDGSITTAKLATDAVTATKLADAAVATASLQDGAVTEAKYADGSVSYDKLKLTGFMTPPNHLTKHPVLRVDRNTGNAVVGTFDILDLTGVDAELANKRLSFFAVPDSPLDIGSQRIINVTNPTGAQDVATKDYVDNTIGGGSKIELLHDQDLGAAGNSKVLFGGGGGAPAWLTDSTYKFYEVVISNFQWTGNRITIGFYHSSAWHKDLEWDIDLDWPTDRRGILRFDLHQPRDGSSRAYITPGVRGSGLSRGVFSTTPFGAMEGVQIYGDNGTTTFGANARVMVYGHRALV